MPDLVGAIEPPLPAAWSFTYGCNAVAAFHATARFRR
jgi:hypothetical protein